MRDVKIAINENNLGSLIFEIDDYVDRISTIFDKYDIEINKLPGKYKSDGCKRLLEYYTELKKSFPVVKKNIKSYGADYRELIVILNSADRKFSGILEKDALESGKVAKGIRVDKKNNVLR